MRALTFGLLLVLIGVSRPAAGWAQEPDHWLIAVVQGVGPAGLPVRAEPSASTASVAVLAEGQSVTVLETAGAGADRWYRIAPVGRADPTPNGWASAASLAVADSINLRAAASPADSSADAAPLACCASLPRPTPPAPTVRPQTCQTALDWARDPVAMVRDGQEAARRTGLAVSQQWSEPDAVALSDQAVTLLLVIPDRFEGVHTAVVPVVVVVSAEARGVAPYTFSAAVQARSLAAWQVCTGERAPGIR